jgi:hypothetical protein
MTTVLDKDAIKEALRELIHEDKSIFKSILLDILQDEELEFNRILKKHYSRFDETFRALA